MIAVYGLGGLALLCYGLGHSIFNPPIQYIPSEPEAVTFRDKPSPLGFVDPEVGFVETSPEIKLKETSPVITTKGI